MWRHFCVLMFGTGVLFGCASSTPSPDPDAKKMKECQSNLQDPECINLLTNAEYETREEVMAAEESRKAKAFTDRLARMRKAEDARQKKRMATRSSSVAVTNDLDPLDAERLADGESIRDDGERAKPKPKPEQPEPGGARTDLTRKKKRKKLRDLDPLALATQNPLEEYDAGSSIRAIRAEKKTTDETLEVVVPKIPKRKVTPTRLPADAPTPEEYLRGSICLLSTDLNWFKQALISAKKKRQTRGQLGLLALVIVDVETVVARVKGEMRHRGITLNGPARTCVSPSNIRMTGLLRRLVGRASNGAEPYSRGLARLTKELEIRAGLPQSQ